MARKKDLFINIILIAFTLIYTVVCSKLNVPRVLLPIFNDISTNFTLEVTEGGCYKWTTSRQDIVQIIPLDVDEAQDCSTSVVVLAISKEPTRNTAIVLAEDIYSGQVLRCDVIVDVISKLNLVTTTRELFMEEAPEAFEVRAYDDQGNEFTTLHGVEFEWSLSSPTKNEENIVLRFITFGDSPYETPYAINTFEEMGKQGHIVLLEGVKTGSAQVSARLPHPEYSKLTAIEVSLMVIANLIIEPSDVYLLRGDVINFKIIQVKHGRLEEIQLPNSQYGLIAENPDVGKMDIESGIFTGLNVGKTRVYLHDSNVQEDSNLKSPSATVYVTYPDRLVLTLLPYRNWATVVGQEHDIAVELYATNDHKIHIGDGVTISINIDKDFFTPSYQSQNGSYVSGKAIEQGPTEIEATLMSVQSQELGIVNFEPQLSVSAQLLIHNVISLNPTEVVLPWDPNVRPKYEQEVKVTGGDGKFLWSTTNHSIGVVSQHGLVRTHFHGQFDTCASMLRNHHNRECSKFFILPPSQIEIIESIMEAEINTPIFLNIALYADRPKPGGTTVLTPFSSCDILPFVVKTSDNNFYYDEKAVSPPVGVACTSVAIIGVTVGTARVAVQYKRDEIILEQSVIVAAYRPLKLLHPCSEESVLALGTTRYLIFTGGPRPNLSRPSEHVIKVTSSNPSVVDAEDVTNNFLVPGGSDTYVIKVTCKDIGDESVKLTIFNKPLVARCPYKESFATATIFCAIPEFISLQPEIKVLDSVNCPMDLSAERVIVQNYRQTDLIVTVKDCNGRKFDNISSFEFSWNLNPSDLATLTHKDGTYEKPYFEDNVCLPNKTFQTVEPQDESGLIEIDCSIIGYKSAILKANKVEGSPSLDTVKTKISLYLVDDTIVLPNRTTIYNHPSNKVSLIVKQGSGFNEVKLNTLDIADVKYNEALRQIEVIPRQPGEVHVTVRDLCLQSQPVVIILNVVTVATIRIEMVDRVEIGRCIPVTVKFYDEVDNLMPLPKLEYLDMRYSIEKKIVNLKVANPSDEPLGIGELHYVLTGLVLGETKIMFATGRGPKEVVSIPVDVQVFPPLKITPRNTTLIVNSVLQFCTEGGPQPDSNVEFSVSFQTPNTAHITLDGILRAKDVGEAQITARSVSIDPITGKKITNSKDTAELHVVPLLGIKISAPLTRFLEGTTVPVWATGLPERLSSLLVGSVDPPFHYSWGTSCPDILSITGMFYPFGVKDNPMNKISVRVRGIRPGTCAIQLNVTLPASATGAKMGNEEIYSTTLDMEVIEGLYLAGPPGFTGKTILMAPFSTLQLKTSRDGYSALKYSVHGEEQIDDSANKRSVSLSRHLISISSDGVISSRDVLGRALVVITAMDEFGLKQTLSLVVQIKPVHYMMLTVQADWMIPFDENIKVVPLGSEFKFITNYYDNTGVKFSAAHCDVNYKFSRSDLVEIKRNVDNSTFSAFTVKEGSTVLKVWADNCFKTVDYVFILTGQVSVPKTKSVTIGDVLCMYSSVTNKDGKHGEWTSDPGDIIIVNATSGIAQIVSPDSTKAYLKYDLTPAAQIGLDVEPISEISFVFDKNRVLTNAPGTVFEVPLLLLDAMNPDKTSNMIASENCDNELTNEMLYYPFECVIGFTPCEKNSEVPNILQVFEVTPAFNKNSGRYSCNIKPLPETSANSSTIKAYVTLKAIASNGVESSPLKIQFLPAIYVPSQDLLVDKRTYIAVLTVFGLQPVLKELKVVPVDDKLIQIGKVKYPSETQVSYDVKIIDYHWKLEELHDPLSVIVISKRTNQKIKVEIHLDDTNVPPICAVDMGSPLGNFVVEYRQTIIILTSTSVIMCMTFYVYSTYMQPVINVNVAPGRPGINGSDSNESFNGNGGGGIFGGVGGIFGSGSGTGTGSGTDSGRSGTGCAARRGPGGSGGPCSGPCGPRCTAPCANLRHCAACIPPTHTCAALRELTHQCAAFADRTMMLTSSQTILNTSQPRPLGCAPGGYQPRNLNISGGSPTMRYGNEDPINRSCGNSPELRRNRRFL